MNTRGNKAKRSKESILADAKNLLRVYLPIYQRMPKIERIDGAPMLFKHAVVDIIRHYSIAYSCQEVRRVEIQQMTGCYGILEAALDVMIAQGLLTEGDFVALAEIMERIEEGAEKWRRSLHTSGAASGQRSYGHSVYYEPSEGAVRTG